MNRSLNKSHEEEIVNVNKYGIPYVKFQENQCNPRFLLRLEVFLFALLAATISFFPRCKFAIKNFVEKIFLI